MGNQVRFKTYETLCIALKRNGVLLPGVTSTLLLETFLILDGNLKAAMAVEKGLCSEGEFKRWRDDLIAKGWLNYTVGEYARHSPGTKLVKYINKEKLQREEIATKSNLTKVEIDLAETKKELEATNKRLDLVERSVRSLIEKHDPPVTEAKLSEYIPKRESKKKSSLSEMAFPPKTTH